MGSILSKDPEKLNRLNQNLFLNSYKAHCKALDVNHIKFPILPANGWNHFCGKSKSVECADSAEDEYEAVVDVELPKILPFFFGSYILQHRQFPLSRVQPSWSDVLHPTQEGLFKGGRDPLDHQILK